MIEWFILFFFSFLKFYLHIQNRVKDFLFVIRLNMSIIKMLKQLFLEGIQSKKIGCHMIGEG